MQRSHRRSFIQTLGLVSAVLALIVAALIVDRSILDHRALREQVHERNLLRMQATAEHLEDHMRSIWLCLRLISLDPDIARFAPGPYDRIQAIHETTYSLHGLTELYIIERRFDGTRHPFLGLYREDDGRLVEAYHSQELEQAEYDVHVTQIARFARDPSLQFLVSKQVPLCVGGRGAVCSVPIRSAGRLTGILAGMVRSEEIAAILAMGNHDDEVVLASDQTGFLVGSTPDTTAQRWLQQRFDRQGVQAFFESRESDFPIEERTALWTSVNIPGGAKWYIAYLYDEEHSLSESAVQGSFATWGSAVAVVLLGLLTAFLCHLVPTLTATREQARCRADELAHSEARYRTLVEDIDLGVTLVDANHNVVMTNGAAERILRRLGNTTGERKCFLGLETSEAACSHCPGTRAMATLRPVEMETEGVRDDGTPFTVRIRALPVCEPDGEATGFIEVVEDITERKRIESQARERQAELAHVARLGTIGEMAAGLAHEINQPLASIVNFLEATLEGLSRGTSDTAALREDIRQATEQAVRAGEIIQRLRSFVGQPRPKRTNVDMNELVGEVVELTMSDVRNLGVATHLELASSLPSVDVDAIQIQQVLVNLIRNGIEAMAGAGTGQLIIRTSAQDEEAVELSVVDSGPGLRGNAADRVFEAFYSTKTDGMGLGLSISRRIIEAHGGRLWATSTNGGATFRFTLPTNHLGVNE